MEHGQEREQNLPLCGDLSWCRRCDSTRILRRDPDFKALQAPLSLSWGPLTSGGYSLLGFLGLEALAAKQTHDSPEADFSEVHDVTN
jgi:hypothetical protein